METQTSSIISRNFVFLGKRETLVVGHKYVWFHILFNTANNLEWYAAKSKPRVSDVWMTFFSGQQELYPIPLSKILKLWKHVSSEHVVMYQKIIR